MARSTVFTSNRGQGVRLPKAVAFPDDVHQVDILKIGRGRLIVPQGKRWDDLFHSTARLPVQAYAARAPQLQRQAARRIRHSVVALEQTMNYSSSRSLCHAACPRAVR